MPNTPKPKLFISNRFTIASTIDGYEVVDRDGRSVTDAYTSASTPLKLAGRLNEASERGGKALARALGAIEDDELFLTTEALEVLAG